MPATLRPRKLVTKTAVGRPSKKSALILAGPIAVATSPPHNVDLSVGTFSCLLRRLDGCHVLTMITHDVKRTNT